MKFYEFISGFTKLEWKGFGLGYIAALILFILKVPLSEFPAAWENFAWGMFFFFWSAFMIRKDRPIRSPTMFMAGLALGNGVRLLLGF